MPIAAFVALCLVLAMLVVGAVVVAVGVATHRFRVDSAQSDDTDGDDLSDDTATLLSLLPGASIVVDEHDEVVRSSPDAYRLGVVSDDAIVDSQVLDAVHKARRSGGKRQFDLTTATPERFIAQGDRKQAAATKSVQRPNWLKVTVGRINDRFVIVLLTDVSEAVRFNQVRDSFITNVSEQLLGPTEALAKLADSLECEVRDPAQIAADARQVRSSCTKLNHMVSDLLLLIRAQEPVTPSSANRLNVMEQLQAIVAHVTPQAEAADVTLNVGGADDVVINGDTNQIDSAVTKLIENAIGYSNPGGMVSITVAKAEDGQHAVIRVIDQGVGIAKKDQSRIFERFYRGAEQSERTADGVGLGLAIVKHVALTHHGDVSVWSTPGQGSTFTLSLPLAR
ncbi:ATPase [Bifidobacterium sp. DSM 109957]|uniref:Sensor-like histidine kinase SenX3 n=2 Tax=Bifidobacterium oedipodis TaxID=2675322 RepID=A0A7Y0EPP9_9BIFI|nr:ATPase [Bifidobacterium sp. DSM 109957]